MLVMRKLCLIVVFALVWLLVYLHTVVPAKDPNVRINIKRAKESVFKLKYLNGVYTGSGFMINTSGNMLTCAHVVDSSQSKSGKYVNALLAENYLTLQTDSNNVINDVVVYNVIVDTVIAEIDIAILTVDLMKPSFRDIENSDRYAVSRPVFMGFSNSVNIWEGQEVITCAYIKDQFAVPKPIIANGIVSTIRNECYDPRMNHNVDIMQLDMNISKGNSGAPVFLPDNGRIVGIIDWGIFQDSAWQTGYAVAISTNQILLKLKELNIPFDFR
jgi:S1-C subfamily serine protease